MPGINSKFIPRKGRVTLGSLTSNSQSLTNNRSLENGKQPGGPHKTPKISKSQFSGLQKPDNTTMEAKRTNGLDYKTDDRPPSQTNNQLHMQTLPPPDSKGTPSNPQGFQGAPID